MTNDWGSHDSWPVTIMVFDQPTALSQEGSVVKMPRSEPIWLKTPEDHDYPAAASYLELLYPRKKVLTLVADLRKAKITKYKAKDIFRASRLSLLGVSNTHVERDRQKIKQAVPLSPILLVRPADNGMVIIADGYHRLCAVYSFDEDAWIPCKIV